MFLVFSILFYGENVTLQQLNGVLVVNKPQGLTSNLCIQKIKRLGQKKIGHAGTLDPMASGVLLCLLGQATKISNYLLLEGSKIYQGTILLGQTTDTWDIMGRILESCDPKPMDFATINSHIASWVELKEQMVPPYSAAKINGQPFYKMARSGKIVERHKTINILHSECLSYEHPYISFRVTCSSGTYIRSLAHSLGMRLGCGASLASLVREYSCPFGLDSAIDLEELLADPNKFLAALKPIHAALPSWKVLEVPKNLRPAVLNGLPIPVDELETIDSSVQQAILMYDGVELALVSRAMSEQTPVWQITRGLWHNRT